MVARPTVRTAEWLAENAFLTPGKHRLLTAAGLSAGLYGGREVMNAVTARNAAQDKPQSREETLAILRPVHGLLHYNPYSDAATDRWKQVADSFGPMVLGAIGAYMGSRHYFYGGKGIKQLAKMTLEQADDAANMAQSNSVAKLASGSFAAGSPFGTHLFGAFFPLNNGMSSVRFQLAKRNPHIPGFKAFNRWMGNRGSSSHKLTESLGLTIKWMESTIIEGRPVNQERLRKAARDVLQIFGKVSPEQEVRMMRLLEDVIEHAQQATKHIKDPEKRAEQVRSLLKEGVSVGEAGEVLGLKGVSLERLFIKAGFREELKTVRLGDNGPMTFFARMLGSAKGERQAEAAYRQHLIDVHGYSPDEFGKTLVTMDRKKAALAVGASGAMAGAAMLVGAQNHDKAEQLQRIKGEDGENTRVDQAAVHHEKQQHISGNVADWVNGAPLDTMHWMSRVVITPPSMHRLMNAAYFSLALVAGTKLGNVMAGRNLKSVFSSTNAGSLIDKSKVWAPLRPLHGILSYTPGSFQPGNRLRQAAHFIMPVAVGMAGTATGSHLFFRDRIKKLEQSEYLEDYADQISLKQSRVYAGATALTSIFNTGSGMHFLPVFNYSSNLHNRFMMAGGYQVAMPGLGKVWSGNPSLFPWGVSRTLDFTVKYMAHNPEEFPRLMPDLAHAVIAKLYPDLSDEELGKTERAFINRVYEIRDPYLHKGRIPEEVMPELEEKIRTAITKEGLERTLSDIGLDPAKANLASNGVAGKIANAAGIKGTTDKLHTEYRQKYEARKQASPVPQLTNERQHEGMVKAPVVRQERAGNSPQRFIERIRNAEAPEVPTAPILA